MVGFFFITVVCGGYRRWCFCGRFRSGCWFRLRFPFRIFWSNDERTLETWKLAAALEIQLQIESSESPIERSFCALWGGQWRIYSLILSGAKSRSAHKKRSTETSERMNSSTDKYTNSAQRMENKSPTNTSTSNTLAQYFPSAAQWISSQLSKRVRSSPSKMTVP